MARGPVLTQDERDLVALHRAVVEYVRERTRYDPTLLDQREPEMVYFQLDTDTSGCLVVEPEDPNKTRARVCTWASLSKAAGVVDKQREALVALRLERMAASGRHVSRRGRRRAAGVAA
jgi:hypothetical protein